MADERVILTVLFFSISRLNFAANEIEFINSINSNELFVA